MVVARGGRTGKFRRRGNEMFCEGAGNKKPDGFVRSAGRTIPL
jgi:hypothetical protein